MREDRIQQESYMWFHNNHPNLRGLLFAVPNGGKRDAVTAKVLRATGTIAGVSDMIFLYKGNAYLLECKTETGYQSKVQKEWQAKVETQGFVYRIFRSKEQFKTIINKILEENGSL